MAVCISPNWERWHSSKMMTTCPSKMVWPLLAGELTKVASFWIVVMMMRASGSPNCFLSLAVDVFELAAPFSKRSYSRIVW
ncbi:MAG: hypothetical protein BWY91_03212 [bacterium ADurb.BinA028]|nr:MAG: hypothetical protein BWY91_03212 [bacterium ADurb.BinA028]